MPDYWTHIYEMEEPFTRSNSRHYTTQHDEFSVASPARHATYARYTQGCRCTACSRVATRRHREYANRSKPENTGDLGVQPFHSPATPKRPTTSGSHPHV